MKILKSIFFITLILIVMCFAACSKLENPRFVSIDKLELVEDRVDLIVLTSEVSVFNPNWFEIFAKDVSFKLYVDTIYIGYGNIEGDMRVSKYDTSIISSNLNIQKIFLDLLIDLKDSVSVKILGSTDIPFTSKKYYFDITHKLYYDQFISLLANRIMQDIKIEINKITMQNVNINNMNLDVNFKLYNQSAMQCEIKKLDIQVYQQSDYKELIGTSVLEGGFIVNSKSFTEFQSQLEVKTLKLVSSMFSNSINNENNFFIKVVSDIEYNNITFPLTINRKVVYNPITLEISLE